LIEVLSKNTSRYDKSEKFNAYKTLPSFREHITIDSLEYFVYTFYKEANGLWRIGNYSKLSQEVEIITLGMNVPMATLYNGVDLGEE
jgi:Uma2 family endonuclease